MNVLDVYSGAPPDFAPDTIPSSAQDFRQLWSKTPFEVRDEIVKEIHRGGHRNVLEHLRYQSRLLHAATTPLLFEFLVFRSREDVMAWTARLDEYEQSRGDKSKLFWLKHVRTFKIFRCYNYLRPIQDFINRISSYSIGQIHHLVVQGAIPACTQVNSLWVTNFIRERKIPNLTWDNPSVPDNVLHFLNYDFASSLCLRNALHFGGSVGKVFFTAPYLNADLGLHDSRDGFSDWERVKMLRINALDEETIEMLKVCTRLNFLTMGVRYDLSPKEMATYELPMVLPNIENLHCLDLTASNDALLTTTELLLVNLPRAIHLQKLILTFKLSWASLHDAASQLRDLVDQVIKKRRPGLISFLICVECYLLLSKDLRQQYPDIAEEIAKIVEFLEELRKNPDFVQAIFFYPLGRECSLEDFSRYFLAAEETSTSSMTVVTMACN
ncbi:hypothetical protein CVT26_003935 [Gymnopilus dilepis]|uniref:Uncharacterized protein n=1 Tax=Gymnopilus dilepis TaxID=231916 RepID=A0A409WPQ8_9AGAR|nr:hypothetical protein CVT26_003935 [Gymnopilus dilepis]